jgi:hypothetical protein
VISVDFGPEPSVVTICEFAFVGLSLKSLRIRATVREIHGTAFRDVLVEAVCIEVGSPYSVIEGDFLIEVGTNKLVQCFSNRPTVLVPSRIETLGKGAFEGGLVSNLAIRFAENSRLLRIEKHTFGRSAVLSLTLPANLEFIDGRAFEDSHIQKIQIAPGNRHFSMCGGFLVGIAEQRLIHYFGTDDDMSFRRKLRSSVGAVSRNVRI